MASKATRASSARPRARLAGATPRRPCFPRARPLASRRRAGQGQAGGQLGVQALMTLDEKRSMARWAPGVKAVQGRRSPPPPRLVGRRRPWALGEWPVGAAEGVHHARPQPRPGAPRVTRPAAVAVTPASKGAGAPRRGGSRSRRSPRGRWPSPGPARRRSAWRRPPSRPSTRSRRRCTCSVARPAPSVGVMVAPALPVARATLDGGVTRSSRETTLVTPSVHRSRPSAASRSSVWASKGHPPGCPR